MDNRSSLVFFLIALYLLINTQSGSPLIKDREQQEVDNKERQALGLLNESHYGDFQPWAEKYLPCKGMRNNDTYAWDALPDVQERARQQLRTILLKANLETPEALTLSSPNVSSSLPVNTTQIRLPVYHNATGRLRGDWVRQEIDRPVPQINNTAVVLENDYITREYSHNITGESGTFYLELLEVGGEEVRGGDGHAREITANLAVESHNALGNMWYLSLYGVHFPETGASVLSSTSEKFGGLFALPHFTLSRDTFELSRRLLYQSLSDTISQKGGGRRSVFPWASISGSEMTEFPVPKCEHIIYLQQHPARHDEVPLDNDSLEQIEQELRFPMGAPIPHPPKLVMSAVLFSPDCGYILETKSEQDYPPSDVLYLTGFKMEQFIKYAGRLIFAIGFIYAAQISLLFRQMKEASTPSTKSRISFYTLAMMAFGDAFILILIFLELFSESSFLILATNCFLVFISVSYLGMKFMMEIWAIQAPERRERERQNGSSNSTAMRPRPLPPPVTAGRDTGATPVMLPPDQDISASDADAQRQQPADRGGTLLQTPGDTHGDVGTMYWRFYFFFMVLVFVSLWAFLWPSRVGALYARTLAFIYLSFWVPQIYRNIMRNCRKALEWEFVVGQGGLRLSPFLYFYSERENILFIRPDPAMAYILMGWMWLQICMLASQDMLGPRFFVPRGWVPPAYDYHPILRDTAESDRDLESGGILAVGALRADERDASEIKDQDNKHRTKDKRRKIFDCAICMQEIEVPVLAAPGAAEGSSMADGAISVLSRRAYMITPCRHIFHSTCLESWMRLRLQCPICRESIPPV